MNDMNDTDNELFSCKIPGQWFEKQKKVIKLLELW